MAQQPISAAGGVVWRGRPDSEREVVVIHRPRYDDWSLPKGKAERGETETDTALREVVEETGLWCRLGRSLGAVRYTDRHGRAKVVHYWAMEPIEDRGFRPGDEVDQLRWLPLTEARALISYDRDREILDAFGSV